MMPRSRFLLKKAGRSSHARAGADIVASSDYGVRARRANFATPGREHKFENIAIFLNAAKYCSGFYGPFGRGGAKSLHSLANGAAIRWTLVNVRYAAEGIELDT